MSLPQNQRKQKKKRLFQHESTIINVELFVTFLFSLSVMLIWPAALFT